MMEYHLTITYTYFVSSPNSQDPPPPHRISDQLRRLRYWSNGCTGENSKNFPKFEISIVNFKIITKFQFSVNSNF